MATAPTDARRWVPRVDLRVLVPVVALIGVEVWYLATQVRSPVVPLMWMAPVDLLLLAYAVTDSLALVQVAIVLFFARFLFLPFLLFAPLADLLVFYALFMAPVDAVIAGYMLRTVGRRVVGSSDAPT